MMKAPDLSEEAPWKRRFRSSQVMAAWAAPKAPGRGLLVSNRDGVTQLYAHEADNGSLRRLTDKNAGIIFGGISPDGRYVYYLDDEQGNEMGHYVRVPFDGDFNSPAEDISPDLGAYASWSLAQSLNGRHFGFQCADENGFHMMVIPMAEDGSLGQRFELYHSQADSYGPIFSHDGDYAVIATTERSSSTDYGLRAFHLDSATPQTPIRDLAEDAGSLELVEFSPLPGDARVLLTNDSSGFVRPTIWDVKSGDRIDIPLPEMQGDVRSWCWSPDGRRLLLYRVFQAEYKLYIYDIEQSTLSPLETPGGMIAMAYFNHDGSEIHAVWSDSTHPASLVALDAATGALKALLVSAENVPASHKWRSVSFKSTGGIDIQAWLVTPPGPGPFPTIIHTHGGPTSVQTETFMPPAQAWVDHGFAWMSVNYRGSMTFGRDFERAILGILGHREVDDMAAAWRWLVDSGIAKPKQVFLTGASYGGYLTLQALGRKPELWAGGMAEVAVADWRLMFDGLAETLAAYIRSLFGGGPDDLPDLYKASSPVTYVEAVSAPLLVIQGLNDTRCPARQMQLYEEKMRAAGKAIEVRWFDAGHGSRAMEQSIRHQSMMLEWAYATLQKLENRTEDRS